VKEAETRVQRMSLNGVESRLSLQSSSREPQEDMLHSIVVSGWGNPLGKVQGRSIEALASQKDLDLKE
jgi:hypothetical protein